jgi:hypothetical protein
MNRSITAMLPFFPNGTEAGCNPLAVTPILEFRAPKLLALVADQVFGRSHRFFYRPVPGELLIRPILSGCARIFPS